MCRVIHAVLLMRCAYFLCVCNPRTPESFESLVAENGLLTRYMELAKIGLVIEDTLFVHGAVKTESMGYVNTENEKEKN